MTGRSTDGIRQFLDGAGYRVIVRTEPWCECFLTKGTERWLGRGLTEDEALADALRQMAPSALAWELVERAMSVNDTRRVNRPGRVAVDTLVHDAPPQVEGIAVTGGLVVNAAPAAAAVPAGPPVAAPAAAPSEPAAADPKTLSTAYAQPLVKRSPAPPTLTRPGRRLDEELQELDILEDRLRDMLPDLAIFTRELQRMGLIAFIARARQIALRVHDERVENTVRRFAGKLTELAQEFWPGSVRSLQLRATPLDAGADLRLADGGRLHDWAEAAEVAERMIDEKRNAMSDAGLDDWGWIDYAACFPAPNDPDARLEALRVQMARVLEGPDADKRLQVEGMEVLQELQRWAKEARWLRPHVEDRHTWGRLMGRLRWAVTRLPRDLRAALDVLLDENRRQPKPWSQELGEDPLAKQRKKQRKELLYKKPEGSAARPDVVAAWLEEAFSLGDAFGTVEIAERIEDLGDIVLALPSDESSGRDRKYRRRLKLLQDDLERRRNPNAAPERAADDGDGDDEPVDQSRDIDEGEQGFRHLLAEVRLRVEGRRALFVSNRADPALKDKLERELGMIIEWAEIDPRRLQARIESVKQRSYDLVLSATGFQGHSVDTTLGRETRAAGLPYVRVHRGRLTSCVRALARSFGLLEAA